MPPSLCTPAPPLTIYTGQVCPGMLGVPGAYTESPGEGATPGSPQAPSSRPWGKAQPGTRGRADGAASDLQGGQVC